MCIHMRSTSVCREGIQRSIGVTLRSTRQGRRKYQAQMPRVLEDDVQRKKTGGEKNSGTYKEAHSYPDVSNRTRLKGHVDYGGVCTA